MKKAAFIFLIFIIIISFSLKSYSLIKPVDNNEAVEILIEIKEGMNGRNISQLLQKKGVIKSSAAFYLLLRFQGIDHLQAGWYLFSTSENVFQIIKKINQGNQAEFKITIPEGFTIEEILKRFAALKLPQYNKDILEREINKQLERIEFKNDLEKKYKNSDLIYQAEGFVIPTTYNFPLSYQENDIAEALIGYFIENRLPILKKAAQNSDYSAYELLIIASLIEKEGKLKSEQKIIASVIYNRLQRSMPLQLDATIQYALSERTKRVLYEDLKIKSPYNTYKIKELPPTPIANPGAEALQAAVEPAQTDYLFYFALKDGSHLFTKSYEKHLKKQQELLD